MKLAINMLCKIAILLYLLTYIVALMWIRKHPKGARCRLHKQLPALTKRQE